jgi:SAM-dependent methyltransferase
MRLTDLTNRKGLGLLLNQLRLKNIGAEIGVAYGENAEQILKLWQGHGLLLVDPWDRKACGEYVDGSANIDFDGAYNHCIERLAKFPSRTIALRMTSDEALLRVADKSLDFVYIDGNHHNPQLKRDLDGWIQKVKPGGIFGGHDFYDLDEPYYKCEVKSTVTKFTADRNLSLHTTMADELDKSWWIQLPA